MLDAARGATPTKPWDVHTYDNTYNGSESLTRATLQSDNTVYAQLTLDVGPRYVWQMAHRLGIKLQPDTPVASIGLGTLAVSPLDMAAAYATFPAMGIYAKPMAITKVILPGGKVDTASGWGKPQTKRARLAGRRVEGERRAAAERPVRHRRRLERRHPSERRQDRDHGRPRRRMVRRLHPPAHDRRLDGLPEGRDPDD